MDRFERITDEHSVDTFRCGNADLDGWLIGAALNSDRSGTARVYLWLDHPGKVIGYFAITPHTVRREGLPRTVARGSPDVIPGFLLARLAVAESAQGRGNGGSLLVEALRTLLEAIRIGGGRVIVVDAIDDNAHSFYEHFGFKSLPETGGPPCHEGKYRGRVGRCRLALIERAEQRPSTLSHSGMRIPRSRTNQQFDAAHSQPQFEPGSRHTLRVGSPVVLVASAGNKGGHDISGVPIERLGVDIGI